MAREVIPLLHTQLDGSPTAGSDCGVMASVMAVAYGKGKRKGPDRRRMRDEMGKRAGPTTSLHQKQGVEGFGVRYTRKVDAPWDGLVRALENGRWVNVQIDYSVVNARRPRLSGSRTFNGGHSISVHGIRDTEEGRQVRVFDPLYDGRAGGIPKGPRWWPLALLKAAAGSFASEDHWTGGVIRAPAPERPAPPEPEPETRGELRQRVEELEEEVITLRDALEVLEDTLEALEAMEGPRVRTALRTATDRLDEILPARRRQDTLPVADGAEKEAESVDEPD